MSWLWDFIFQDLPIGDGDYDISIAGRTSILTTISATAGGIVYLMMNRKGCILDELCLTSCSAKGCSEQADIIFDKLLGFVSAMGKAATLGLALGPPATLWIWLLDTYIPIHPPNAEMHAVLTVVLECFFLNPAMAVIPVLWRDICYPGAVVYRDGSFLKHVFDDAMPTLRVSFFVWPVATIMEPLILWDYMDFYEYVIWLLDFILLFRATMSLHPAERKPLKPSLVLEDPLSLESETEVDVEYVALSPRSDAATCLSNTSRLFRAHDLPKELNECCATKSGN